MNLIKIFKIFIVIAWMSLIFVLSHIAFPEADDYEKQKTISDMLYDKDLHFLIFGVLSYLVVSALIEFKIKFSIIAIITVLFCYIYGVSDEFHQGHIAGRDVSWMDVLFDVLGAMGGILFYKVLHLPDRK